MSAVLAAISDHAKARPDSLALSDGESNFSYRELERLIAEVTRKLKKSPARTIALALDNSPLWAVLDLAAASAGLPVVPLPHFFSPAQIFHAISDSGVNVILTDRPDFFEKSGLSVSGKIERNLCGKSYVEFYIENGGSPLIFPDTAKITYTSGTTGQPKGVCLSRSAMEAVAVSLGKASGANARDRYVSLLPLSTLLENIGGVHVPLLAGAACFLLPLEKVGLYGASRLDVEKMSAVLQECGATSTILTPQLLQALISYLEAKARGLASMRFVAVGGAPVPLRLLKRAQNLGLPVFEGYGLSESASVVSLNTPEGNLPGSAGKPLPHVKLKFAEDGEIMVKGSLMLGYAGGDSLDSEDYFATGDVGFLDEAGFLHLTGRKKNIFITSFGRNVSPEWVEMELTHHPVIAQAAVFGEGRPWNVAVIVPRNADLLPAAIDDANAELPDYAKVSDWIVADSPFTPENGQMTPNGRLKREAIYKVYGKRMEQLYHKGNHGLL